MKTRNRSRGGRARAIDYGFCRARTWGAFERSYECARGLIKKNGRSRAVAARAHGVHSSVLTNTHVFFFKKRSVGRAPKKRP
jgi:hypothetical protein